MEDIGIGGGVCGLDTFPQEIIEHIVGYLCRGDGVGLACAGVVSRRWRWTVERLMERRRFVDAPKSEAWWPLWGIAHPACRRAVARQALFRRALETGDIDLLAWLARLHPRLWLWLACERHGEQCRGGRRAIDLKMRAWSIASGGGSLDCLKWLARMRWKRYGQEDRILVAAAAAGHVHVLDWLCSMIVKRCQPHVLVEAAVSSDIADDVEVLDWLRGRHTMTDDDVECILRFARRRDRVPLLAWVLDHSYGHARAIAGSHRAILEWHTLVRDYRALDQTKQAVPLRSSGH